MSYEIGDAVIRATRKEKRKKRYVFLLTFLVETISIEYRVFLKSLTRASIHHLRRKGGERE
jgi:hypothetical protein